LNDTIGLHTLSVENTTTYVKHSTSIGVSLLSAAAISVSMFNAEPNPVLNIDSYIMLTKACLKQLKVW
jgi:hypothetical protein